MPAPPRHAPIAEHCPAKSAGCPGGGQPRSARACGWRKRSSGACCCCCWKGAAVENEAGPAAAAAAAAASLAAPFWGLPPPRPAAPALSPLPSVSTPPSPACCSRSDGSGCGDGAPPVLVPAYVTLDAGVARPLRAASRRALRSVAGGESGGGGAPLRYELHQHLHRWQGAVAVNCNERNPWSAHPRPPMPAAAPPPAACPAHVKRSLTWSKVGRAPGVPAQQSTMSWYTPWGHLWGRSRRRPDSTACTTCTQVDGGHTVWRGWAGRWGGRERQRHRGCGWVRGLHARWCHAAPRRHTPVHQSCSWWAKWWMRRVATPSLLPTSSLLSAA